MVHVADDLEDKEEEDTKLENESNDYKVMEITA